MRKALTFIASGALLLVPMLVSAQFDQLVPTCGTDGCQACHAVALAQNVINFLVGIAAFIAVLIFSYAGFLMITAAGNVSQVERAKSFFWNVLIGMLIVLAGWLIIDTVMRYAFVGSELSTTTEGEFGPWNQINCVDMSNLRNPGVYDAGRPTVGGGTDAVLPTVATGDRIARTNQYRTELCTYAAQNGVGSQCDHLQAIMAIESNGDPNVVSPKGAVGLMQIMPSTARVLDSSLRGLSDAEVIAKLKNPSYNMQLATKLYAQDYNYYNGDTTKISSAYNGGRGANAASKDCPGLMRWECVWDSPGCYGTANTSCKPNTGYKETRNYVVNVQSITNKLNTTP